MNIDKIYKMLSSDNKVSTQLLGIKKGKKIKNLWVFIMPILSTNSKSIWENCAKILVSKNDKELYPYLTELLRWLQDMNWPGSKLIYDRLLEIRICELEIPLKICSNLAKITNDISWQMAIASFQSQLKSQETQGDGS